MILSDKEIRLDIYVNSPVMLRHTMVNIVVTGDTIISGSPVLPSTPLSTGKWLMWSINHLRDNIPGSVRHVNTSSLTHIIKHLQNV